MRYLGYGENQPDVPTLAKIKACEKQLIQAITPRYLLRYFSIMVEEEGVRLENTSFKLEGKDIAAHLKGCTKAALFAATLSLEADKLIRQAQVEDLVKGIIMDCCATAMIEQVCDQVDAIMQAEMQGMHLMSRYSPGYGDLPITVQKEFLQLLDAPRKIGLCASQSHILIPRKSVTAIVGISEQKQQPRKHSCAGCNLKETCLFQKRGDYCDVSNAT